MHDNRAFFFSATAWKQRLAFWAGAILIGLVIVLMTWLSEWAGETYLALSDRCPWFIVVVPPLGLAFIAWLTFRFFPGSERSGIPQVKTALDIMGNFEDRSRLISLRITVGKLFLPILGLLAGASVGFGGPAVHVGASMMASVGKAVKFPPNYMEKGLIMAGSAAGFAAMFSAPLTGIVFAVEEMGRALEERISSLVLTAIVLSGITAYAIMGRYIFFEDNALSLPWGTGWTAIPICGVAGGFFGALFSRIVVSVGAVLAKLSASKLLIAMLCGSVIGLLGYYSGGASIGTGYQQTLALLKNPESFDVLFPVYKMTATLATFFSGIPAGVFVPSFATGAGFGADLAHWFPVAPAAVMILLTISAYFSGMLQSPLTSFVIVMEMTDCHEILMPLMATAFIATVTSKLINPIPLYRALCEPYYHTRPDATENSDETT
ncbi:MAG: chloride channel protein [Gammaproteobacteria bacterium]